MKLRILVLSMIAFLSSAAGAAETPKDFNGAIPQPIGKINSSISQLRIKFPARISKDKNGQKEIFTVSCVPAIDGFSSWADNDSIWTFNFKAKDDFSFPRIEGGTKCEVKQIQEITALDGRTWSAGTINYHVIVNGPNVTEVYVAEGFQGTLREKEPVLLLVFDGAVDRKAFFTEQNGYLSYLSANAPREKIPLTPVPEEQLKKIFSHFNSTRYLDIGFNDKNWILATAQPNLIPGAQLNLTIHNQTSSANSDVRSEEIFNREYTVRSEFQAKIQCANPSAKNATCLPHSPITVVLNGRAKWMDMKATYIEYIPYLSTDGKLVRSYPELNQEVDLWDSILNALAEYFPFLVKYSDTVVDSVVFKLDIEPETQAKVVLPSGLTDIDGRILSNAIAEFYIRIGTMEEVIHTPQTISIFEKNVSSSYLPVGIVNLNQKISIRKTGIKKDAWEPIHDAISMINLIRAYEIRGTYRNTPEYLSPLDQLGIKNTVSEQQLNGTKNRPVFLQFPFAKANEQPKSGFYAIEISSPTLESRYSESNEKRYYNPKYVLTQVTDLAVHLKKGQSQTLVWVTHLSNAQSVSGAKLEIYNCLGEKIKTLNTDSAGLASFQNEEWAKSCNTTVNTWSSYFSKNSFYIVASKDDDMTLTHSSWTSPNTYAMSAPNVDWYYSEIFENRPHFHSVIGVNLVKPGQTVPIQFIAKLPHAKGFSEVPLKYLPTTARIANADDDDIYYDLPLTWKNGTADTVWNVPADPSVKLGRYTINLKGIPDGSTISVSSHDIEVAEFKVPLMTGIITFPNQSLVTPNSIPVHSIIRYANGVGAKKLAAEIAYYFEPTTIKNKELKDFVFGTGAVKLSEDESTGKIDLLPRYSRPSVISDLQTDMDGVLSRDIAVETTTDGHRVSEILKTLDHPEKLVVRVRYQDQMGEFQTLSQAKNIFNSNEYVGIHLVPGEKRQARLQTAILNVNQKNTTSLKNLEFKLLKVETKIIGEELYGGLIKNTIERELKPVRWGQDCFLEKQIVNCRVGSLQNGNYAFQVISKNSKQAAHTFFKVDSNDRVYGPNDYYNFGDDENNKQLSLALNKKLYKDGDRAVVSFSPPFKSCQALVTLERNDVMESFVTPNACEKGFVEIPVHADFAPNSFVSVYAITGRAETTALKVGEMDLGRPTYRLGYANLKVNWDRYKSNVIVKTNKDIYEPGEIVTGVVKVTPDSGTLQGGTVTIVAIEEKILELKNNDSYKLLESLMQLRMHDVETITPLEKIETIAADNSDLPDKDSRKGGDEGGDGSSKSEFKRKLFNALVSFQAGIPVSNGTAEFSFKANDSLARFKIFAISTDSAQKFGTGETTYLAEKDSQAYSNIPTVAHTGDTYPLKITLQNNGSKSSKYKTTLEIVIRDGNGKVIGRKTMTKEFDVDSSSSKSVDLGEFTVEEDANRIEYAIHVYDENGKLIDSIEPEAQTIIPSVPISIRNSFLAQVENGTFTHELTKEKDAIEGKGEIRVSISNSLVTVALKQIQQRIAKNMFADFFIEAKFHKAFFNSTESKPEELRNFLNTLVGASDAQGFIKYYPQASRGSIWLTASIINTLQQEPWALKLLPPALSQKIQGAVSKVLSKSVSPDYVGSLPMDWLRAQAVMGRSAFAFNNESLKSAAQAVNATIENDLKNQPLAFGLPIEKWSNSDLVNVWLLQVFANPVSALNSSLYVQLLSPSRIVYTGNMAQLNGHPIYSIFYSDETTETANFLLGYALVHGDNNFARSLATGLINLSPKGWYNTSTMMNVALSLKEFGRAYESKAVKGTSQISIPEQQASGLIDWDHTKVFDLKTPWSVNTATVKVAHSGEGNPWIGIQGLTAVPITAPTGQGLSIEKEIKNLSRESGYQAGDVIEVTLKLNSGNTIHSVALHDPIPAGSNILSEAYGSYSSGQKSYSGYKFYFDLLMAGLTTVKYQYQLNNPGTFKLPPTHAEALFMPSIFADNPNGSLTVK